MDRLTQRLTQALDAAAATPGGEALGAARPYLDAFVLTRQARGMATVFYAPQAATMLSGGFLSSLTVYDVADPAAFLAGQKQYLQQLADVAAPLPAAGAGAGADQPAGQLTFKTTYTDNALIIDGVNVDQYSINLLLPPEMMQRFGPTAALLGNSGQSGYLAAKGNRVLITTVADPQLITRGLQTLDADAGLGQSGPIATLRADQLPDDAWAEVYFNLAGVAQSVNPFLPMLLPRGQPLVIPADLPPLAMGVTSDPQSVRVRLVLPPSMLKFSLDSYDQLAPALAPLLGLDGITPQR